MDRPKSAAPATRRGKGEPRNERPKSAAPGFRAHKGSLRPKGDEKRKVHAYKIGKVRGAVAPGAKDLSRALDLGVGALLPQNYCVTARFANPSISPWRRLSLTPSARLAS